MKRNFIFIFGLAASLVAYAGVYFASSSRARDLQSRPQPELAWLKQEYNLSDAEFKRISELHEAYLPQCREMCMKIDAKNAEIRTLLETSTNVTSQVQTALNEAAALRAKCQSQMLNHFFEVSRTMSPEQGKRYLAWVRSKTLHGNGGGMVHGEGESHNVTHDSMH